MSNYKYAVSVEQSHGYMSDLEEVRVWKLKDIGEIYIPMRMFSQIGAYPNYVLCKQIVIEPTYLTIPIYVSMHNTDANIENDILEKLNSITRDDVDSVTVELKLVEDLSYENYQRLKIWKLN